MRMRVNLMTIFSKWRVSIQRLFINHFFTKDYSMLSQKYAHSYYNHHQKSAHCEPKAPVNIQFLRMAAQGRFLPFVKNNETTYYSMLLLLITKVVIGSHKA